MLRYRKLRIAWSVGCGILCLLLIALWVRSYTYWDHAWTTTTGGKYLSFGTSSGALAVIKSSDPSFPTLSAGWEFEHTALGSEPAIELPWFLDYVRDDSTTALFIRFRLILVVCVACGVLPWIPWVHWRFSLRTLLIGMTVAAVALGLIFALSR